MRRDIREADVLELGLSQIYLSRAKLDGVLAWFCPERAGEIAPLPVRDFGDGRYTLTDGHTRAYAAYLAGIRRVPVRYDDEEIVSCAGGQKLYESDIKWCARFGLRCVADLKGRILSPIDYERLWKRRCGRGYNLTIRCTDEARVRRARDMFPGLYLYGMDDALQTLYYEDAGGVLYRCEGGMLTREEPPESCANLRPMAR